MSDIPVNQIVNVSISLSGGGAQSGDFGLPCVWGTSNIITPVNRYGSFNNLIAVGAVFPTDSEEYKVANIVFDQNPAPLELWIARWIETAAAGYFKSNKSTTALSSLTSISDGTFDITINGISHAIDSVDLTGVLSWSDVAAAFQAAIRLLATGGFTLATVQAILVTGGVQFLFTSGTTGASSTVAALTAAPSPLSGTDLVSLLGLGLGLAVAGANSETAVQAIQAVQALNDSFFGVLFTNSLRDTSVVLDVAAYIQTLQKTYFTVSNDSDMLDPSDTTSNCYQAKQFGYSHTMFIYTPNNEYPDASIMSILFTVNYSGVDTVKNPNFKALPGITSVSLTVAQLNALKAVNGNTIISVKGQAFFSDGRMAGNVSSQTFYFDTWHFICWLQDYIQTNMLNLYLSKSNIPYSDAGVQMEVQNLNNSLQQGVTNGGLSPLSGENNTVIPAYEVLAPPRVATIPLSQRATRISPTLQFTANGSGAINSVTIIGVLTQ